MLYVYDASQSRRIFTQFSNATRIEARGTTFIDAQARTTVNLTPQDLVIAHQAEAGVWTTLCNTGARVVRVSLPGFATAQWAGGCSYERRAGVSNADATFVACVNHFLGLLNRGTAPDFSILEGPPAPDALLAHHLLGLLPHDPAARALRASPQLEKDARDEASVIARAAGVTPPQLDTPAVRDLLIKHT